MGIICQLLQLYLLVVLAQVVLSWFPATGPGALATVQRVLRSLTEPVLGPLRSVLPPVRLGGMALDLSPLVVIVGIYILTGILCG